MPANFLADHGYWVVGLVVALESMGLPVPGETALVSAAIFAGTSHRLNIWIVIASAAIGAIAGSSAGYWIGRAAGHPFLLKHGEWIRMTPRRIKLGQYLFKRHGGSVIFFGRFLAVLRALASLLAGVNYMDWRRFLAFTAAGAVAWALVFGLGAYALGHELERVRRSAAVVLSIAAILAVGGTLWFVRRHEAALEDEAERAMPGPPR